MWNSRRISQLAAITIVLNAAAFGGVIALSYDKLDGADPGFVAVGPNLVIVDVFADVYAGDPWIASGIAANAHNSALLRYALGFPLFSPGTGWRYVTFLSAPCPRDADARFTDAGALTGGRYCPTGQVPVATTSEINASWFANPPPLSGSSAVDGYIMRVALDISGTPYTPAQCRVYGDDAPASGVPLLVANCGGIGAASFDRPAVLSHPFGVYAVPWGALGDFYEEQGGDAPDLPGFAELITSYGWGQIARITGNLGISDVDLFAFRIDNPAHFSATTMDGASIDTQLFLFDANGQALVYSDNAAGQIQQSLITPQFVQSPGTYYLAVSRYDRDPVNPNNLPIWTDTPREGERPPNGQGANNPFLAGWSGTTNAGGNYAIYLTGATTLCTGDVDGSGEVELADLAVLLTNYGRVNGARLNQGNVDGDADVDLDDLAGLLSRFGASCQ